MDECCSSSNNTKIISNACPITYFKDMVPTALEYVKQKKAEGFKIVGITCEYTPRELIMAGGGIPVCLCGGSNNTIPAAESCLPSNLCPLIKSTFGYSLKKSNPFLEIADLIIVETTCDGKKKMYELLSESHKVYVLELPQKSLDKDSYEHWVKELYKLKSYLEEEFAVQITDEKISESIKNMNYERELKRKLASLMKNEEPPLTGKELLDLKSLIACIPDDLEVYKNGIHALHGRKLNSPAKDRTRVLITGVPIPHGAERVINLIEGSSGLVVAQENCTGLKPIYEDVDESNQDLIDALAKKYFQIPCSVFTKNNRRFELLEKMVDEYKPDCIIELIWQACLTYDIESYYVKQFAERIGLPYLKIETDYSPSDNERIILRVQALFETINRKTVGVI